MNDDIAAVVYRVIKRLLKACILFVYVFLSIFDVETFFLY